MAYEIRDPWKPPLPIRRWLTTREAADYLALRVPQFERGVEAHKLKAAFFVEGEPRYDVESIDELMEAQIKPAKKAENGDPDAE